MHLCRHRVLSSLSGSLAGTGEQRIADHVPPKRLSQPRTCVPIASNPYGEGTRRSSEASRRGLSVVIRLLRTGVPSD